MGGNKEWCSCLVFCCGVSLGHWGVVMVRAGAKSSHNLTLCDEVMSMQ